MRYLLIVITCVFLLAIPVAAQAGDDSGRPAKLMRMLAEWMKEAGTQLSAKGNTVEPAFVDGTGNTVFNIDKIEINFDIGDVAVSESDEVSSEGGNELAHHLLDILGEKMRSHGGLPHPPITIAPGEMHGMPSEMHHDEMGMPRHGMRSEQFRGKMPGGMHGKMRGEMPGGMHGELHPRSDMPSEIHRGEMWMPGGMRFEQFFGTPEHQEMFEMFQMIPPDVDPGFFEFIMHVGELAWEHPEFRERLEMLVDKAHDRLD